MVRAQDGSSPVDVRIWIWSVEEAPTAYSRKSGTPHWLFASDEAPAEVGEIGIAVAFVFEEELHEEGDAEETTPSETVPTFEVPARQEAIRFRNGSAS